MNIPQVLSQAGTQDLGLLLGHAWPVPPPCSPSHVGPGSSGSCCRQMPHFLWD
jgi:hypothetical protein